MASRLNPNQVSRALDELRSNEHTTQTLSDKLQISYPYTSSIIAHLKRMNLLIVTKMEGRTVFYKAATAAYTIPTTPMGDTADLIAHWIKVTKARMLPKSAAMTNTHLLKAILLLLQAASEVANNPKTNIVPYTDPARLLLVRYRDIMMKQTEAADAVLNNPEWWSPEGLARIAQSPKMFSKDRLDHYMRYITQQHADIDSVKIIPGGSDIDQP